VTKTTIRIRGVVALSMLILLLFMVTTGSMLLVAQRGGVMPLPLWNFATRAHPVGGFLFLALGIGHAALNWKLFESDLKALREKKRRDPGFRRDYSSRIHTVISPTPRFPQA